MKTELITKLEKIENLKNLVENEMFSAKEI